MKRIISYMLIVFVLAAGMAACGKTNKGKMSNEWKVTSMESKETYENSTGSKTVSTFTMTESTITETNYYEYVPGPPAYTEIETSEVNANEFIINKDGTWSWVIDATQTTSNGTHQEILEQAGTWSFLDRTKGDDFKKNERVLFNVLTLKARNIVIENGITVDDFTDNLTYTTGKSTMIYTVIESKKDKLELEMDAENVTTTNSNMSSGMNANTSYRKITLEAR